MGLPRIVIYFHGMRSATQLTSVNAIADIPTVATDGAPDLSEGGMMRSSSAPKDETVRNDVAMLQLL